MRRASTAARRSPKATKFAVVAVITFEDTAVWVGRYSGHDLFDDKAACEAFIASDDPTFKESNDGLEAVAKQRIHPDAKVGVSCQADQSED